MKSKGTYVFIVIAMILSLSVGSFYAIAQDDTSSYYGNIEVERMASRIDRYTLAMELNFNYEILFKGLGS